MHFHGLDMNLLVALDRLLDARNTTRAAERMFVAQSTMSGALNRLREYFDDELLVQVGRRMVPTPLGEALAEPVRDIVLRVETALRRRPDFDPATSDRRFRLLMSDYVETVLMARLLPRLQQLAPGAVLELLPYNDAPWESLDRGDIDMLLMPAHYLHTTHPSQPLFDDDYRCVMWSGNPASAAQPTRDEYFAAGHVVVRFGNQRVPAFDEAFMVGSGLRRRAELIVNDFNALAHTIVGTTRVATMQTRLARYYERLLPLRVHPLPVETPHLIETAVWHRLRDADQGIAWLRGLMAEAMQRDDDPA
ncbi:MAG: LysR family transcriptional regulator [Burkholderiaceae bacterium]|nr:LysR family transcriptional regulator [Burkholderiaceae bacterium]